MSKTESVRLSAVATGSVHDRIALVDQALLDTKADDALRSARKREIHVFHTKDTDTLQRMLNAIQPGSYIAPHRHNSPPKAESIILLQGALGYVVFDERGEVVRECSAVVSRARGVLGIDSRAGAWHTFFALEANTVVFEAKPGPFDPATDKAFAPWAPREGSPEALSYLMALEDSFRTVWGLGPREWHCTDTVASDAVAPKR